MKIQSLLLVLISGSNYECSTRPKNIGRSGLEVIGNQVIVDVPENILRLSGLVRDAFEFCCNDENFKRKAKAEE